MFKERYFKELDGKKKACRNNPWKKEKHKTVTPLFAAKDVEYNNTVTFRKYLLAHSQRKTASL
ncbi:MAG: hypothetical protein QXF28_04945 [Nitrososphaerota archaeon]